MKFLISYLKEFKELNTFTAEHKNSRGGFETLQEVGGSEEVVFHMSQYSKLLTRGLMTTKVKDEEYDTIVFRLQMEHFTPQDSVPPPSRHNHIVAWQYTGNDALKLIPAYYLEGKFFDEENHLQIVDVKLWNYRENL